MKLIDIFAESNIIQFKTKPRIPTNKPIHVSSKPMPGKDNHAEIENLIHRYVNLGVGDQILYNNRLAQIMKVPDNYRFVIKFDDTGEKKIIAKKDDALDLIPEEQL